MAQTCIFCGRELGFFTRQNITCGGVEQPACSQCYEMLRDLSLRERGERALATGRAVDPERIMANLEEEAREEQAARERQERARRAIRTDRTCLRCGGPMERCGRKLFHLGDEGLFGPVARDGLFASWLEADVFRCANCGWGEFYLPEPPEAPGAPEEEQVTCPVCGGRHSPLISCPWCAAREAGTGRSAPAEEGRQPARRPQPSKKPERKPPWEK